MRQGSSGVIQDSIFIARRHEILSNLAYGGGNNFFRGLSSSCVCGCKVILYSLWIVGMSVGYVKFPSIPTSTLVKTGNLIGVNILYVMPFLKRMVESELNFVRAAVRAGVSSFPGA